MAGGKALVVTADKEDKLQPLTSEKALLSATSGDVLSWPRHEIPSRLQAGKPWSRPPGREAGLDLGRGGL